MDFARDQLSKHGWTEGQGLGKTKSGITEAIKVKIKQNKTGVGHDPGEEFTFHWWDHVFNKAASKIKVKTTEDGVEIENDGSTKVSKKKENKTYCNKNMLYGQFVKGATLSGGSETKDGVPAESTDDEEQTDNVQCLMPDQAETVFKMCGGRTAHKGARHGLKLNGKLQRLEEQEKLLVEQYNASKKCGIVDSVDENVSGVNGDIMVEKKSKKNKKEKRKRKHTEDTDSALQRSVEDVVNVDNEIKENAADAQDDHVDKDKPKKRKKSKKNKDKKKDENSENGIVTNEVNDFTITELTSDSHNPSSCKKHKKKKKRKCEADVE